MASVEVLVGKTLLDVRGLEAGSERVEFVCDDGTSYRMYHLQDCCESVLVEEVIGDVADLIETPVLAAEESSNHENRDEIDDSCTWTFYRFQTAKGSLTLRWFGTSNGYYSESVDFEQIEERRS